MEQTSPTDSVTQQELYDAVQGLLGVFATPLMRLKLGKGWSEYHEHAVQQARTVVRRYTPSEETAIAVNNPKTK
jgi:hypothetical protein